MRVKNAADHLIKTHGTNCPFSIAKDKGISILYSDLGSVYGYYFVYKRIPIININEALEESMQRVVCAHELGHAILHPKVNTSFMKRTTFFSLDKYEKEANKFAAELLISDEDIYEINNLEKTACLHGVPLELVKLKHCCREHFL